ncbi:MAG: YgiQ family radical SAM protein [Bacteroidales bacterium]|nr:YgiQ family radical SAM protein [Bacteroidales bacterium]
MADAPKALFLPITADEVRARGWEWVDVVLVSGDAYVDHPSFGTAVLGRTLEAEGFRVAIIPQPNWRDDLRDFRKFGRPRLFFGVTSGCMDSMVNHYTAARRLRHTDAYTPGGQSGFRPDRAAYVYTRILKQLYPDVPVVVGGIEASMRRFAHYDYWDDVLKPSFLMEAPADLLVYGMGERPIVEIARTLSAGRSVESLWGMPQVAYVSFSCPAEATVLHSFEVCQASKRKQAENFRIIELESNKIESATLVQPHGNRFVVVAPPGEPLTTAELDRSFELPYQRKPHPKYQRRGAIPAFDMIKHSINTHRGCFGGCSFCTISAHQGKQIVSRSEASILREVRQVVQSDDFHGTLTDLGGPSANMYGMQGRDPSRCRRCARYSCIHPTHCANLVSDHRRLIDLCHKVSQVEGVRHLYIGSGIRCDLFTADNAGYEYFRRVVEHHVSGRLKVAPEHTSERVLSLMRKPSFEVFRRTKRDFDSICRRAGLRYQLIPYFISSHPGCTIEDMAELAVEVKAMGYRLEQIQDFTPTPMTLSTEMYYTGYNPATMQPVQVARDSRAKHEQNLLFFYYKPECQEEIRRVLQRTGNERFIPRLLPPKTPFRREKNFRKKA